MQPKKAVGIWIRLSTEDQAEGIAPELHLKRAQLYAEQRGWEVKVVYHLEGVSGKSVMEHPETKKMLKDIKDGIITGLIFSKLARLARSTKELLTFADLFEESHADLISLQEAIDTSTPAGRLFYTIIAAMCQWEREEIASRVQASVPIRAKLGKPLGGAAPYGYKWAGEKKNKQFVIDEAEAPVRMLMYELFLKYKRKKTTAEELNRLGYRTRNGSKFTITAVDRLLRDPVAKGVRRANFTTVGKDKLMKQKPTADWILVDCPALISEDMWAKCNLFLDEHKPKRQTPGRRSAYLLAGYVTCSCGKKMYVFHKNRVYRCKACKKSIAVSDIDDIYYEILKTFLLADADITQYQERSNAMLQEKEQLLKTVTEEAERIRIKMEELVSMRLNRELSSESFPKHYKPLEDRLPQLEAQIPTIAASVDTLKVQHLSSSTILSDAKDLYIRWPTMSFEERRAIVEIITEHIIIEQEDVSIKLSYLPTTPSLKDGTKCRHHTDM